MLVPVPPQCEQDRIVKQLREMMDLCSKLKLWITNAQVSQVQLADAIVEQAVSP